MNLPFKEKKISKNEFIREFSYKNSDEFNWHKDKEDRIIEPIMETDWMIQFDNQLPKLIEGKIFIPLNIYHRLIRGSGKLKIILTKV